MELSYSRKFLHTNKIFYTFLKRFYRLVYTSHLVSTTLDLLCIWSSLSFLGSETDPITENLNLYTVLVDLRNNFVSNDPKWGCQRLSHEPHPGVLKIKTFQGSTTTTTTKSLVQTFSDLQPVFFHGLPR